MYLNIIDLLESYEVVGEANQVLIYSTLPLVTRKM
jgi:hypothetical protein